MGRESLYIRTIWMNCHAFPFSTCNEYMHAYRGISWNRLIWCECVNLSYFVYFLCALCKYSRSHSSYMQCFWNIIQCECGMYVFNQINVVTPVGLLVWMTDDGCASWLSTIMDTRQPSLFSRSAHLFSLYIMPSKLSIHTTWPSLICCSTWL